MCGVQQGPHHSSVCGRAGVSAPFVVKTAFLRGLSWLPHQKSIDYKCEGLFLASQFYFIPLIHVCILILIPHTLDYFRFLVSFEIRTCESTLFFFKIILAILGSLHFHMNFRVNLTIWGENSWDYNGDCIGSEIGL